MKFQIWAEGYRVNGDQSDATLFGEEDAPDFESACRSYADANPKWADHFDPARLTYWGCRLFDNEADARKTFG